jgi:hypothetical protein
MDKDSDKESKRWEAEERVTTLQEWYTFTGLRKCHEHESRDWKSGMSVSLFDDTKLRREEPAVWLDACGRVM